MSTEELKGEEQPPLSFWIATTSSTPYDALDRDLTVDVAVIGAGIVGITTASLLTASGLSVALLEADEIVRGVTGHTTAKVTSLHTLIYDELTRERGQDAARLYGEANEAGLATIRLLCSEHSIECDLKDAAAYTFAATDDDVEAVEKEVEAALAVGLPAAYENDVPLPFSTHGAARFDGQAQFHPRKYVLALAEQLARAGGLVFERSRVIDIEAGTPSRVKTESGHVVTAENVIVATHAPIVDSKLLVARAKPERGYALAVETAEPLEGMFISASSPSHSVRSAPYRDRPVLIISGEGHPVGEPGDASAQGRWQLLERWAREELGAGQTLFRWSTQDYYSLDRLPFIGAIGKRIFAATGFGGWGMTTGTAAAMLLRDLVNESDNPWAELFDPGRLELRAVPSLIAKGAHDTKRLIGDRFNAEHPDAVGDLAAGEGRIVQANGSRLAVSRDNDGTLHTVSAVCTHLGCIVDWNDAEHSWDCPCHGSRFSPDGDVLQGPAATPLEQKAV